MGRGAKDGDHDSHEEARGYALAADIANCNREVVSIQHEEVEEVATHFPRRPHIGVEINRFRSGGQSRCFWKERLLDDGGTCQFVLLAPLVEDLAGKTVEGRRNSASCGGGFANCSKMREPNSRFSSAARALV